MIDGFGGVHVNFFVLAWNIPERFPIIAEILLGILVLFIWIYFWNRKKKRKKDEHHALRRMREDALDRALANPMQNNDKSIEMQRRPFQVEYSKGDVGQNNSEKMLQLTEITELSKRKYMFRCRELISIGNQFGSTAILSDAKEENRIDCQIFYYEGANYVRSMGRKDIILKRREKKVMVNELGIKLLSKDSFVVDQTTFRIDFL